MRKHIKISPKTFKYARSFRIKINNSNISSAFVILNNYEYGLKALEFGKIKKRHLELCIRVLRKLFKKTIFLKINVSLIMPFSKKPLEMRMGKGKGQRDH
jgi:large subunit ribosomal protein L16